LTGGESGQVQYRAAALEFHVEPVFEQVHFEALFVEDRAGVGGEDGEVVEFGFALARALDRFLEILASLAWQSFQHIQTDPQPVFFARAHGPEHVVVAVVPFQHLAPDLGASGFETDIDRGEVGSLEGREERSKVFVGGDPQVDGKGQRRGAFPVVFDQARAEFFRIFGFCADGFDFKVDFGDSRMPLGEFPDLFEDVFRRTEADVIAWSEFSQFVVTAIGATVGTTAPPIRYRALYRDRQSSPATSPGQAMAMSPSPG